MSTPIIDPNTLTDGQKEMIRKYILRPSLHESETEAYYRLGEMDFFLNGFSASLLI